MNTVTIGKPTSCFVCVCQMCLLLIYIINDLAFILLFASWLYKYISIYATYIVSFNHVLTFNLSLSYSQCHMKKLSAVTVDDVHFTLSAGVIMATAQMTSADIPTLTVEHDRVTATIKGKVTVITALTSDCQH